MSSKVSFEGIGEVAATFYAASGVEAGQVVKVSGEAKVAPCTAAGAFDGVALTVKDGYAAVQVAGFALVSCADETVAAGRVSLVADGNGGVRKPGTGETGQERLVVSVADGMATIML